MRLRIFALFLLVFLCSGKAGTVPAACNPGEAGPVRPVVQKYYPLSLRYRQQIRQCLFASLQSPAPASSSQASADLRAKGLFESAASTALATTRVSVFLRFHL